MNLGQPAFGSLTTAVDFGLDIRRVAIAAMPFEDALVLGLDVFPMRFDIVDRRLNIARRQSEHRRNAVAMPAVLQVVHDVEDGDSRSGDLRPASAVNDQVGVSSHLHGSSPVAYCFVF